MPNPTYIYVVVGLWRGSERPTPMVYGTFASQADAHAHYDSLGLEDKRTAWVITSVLETSPRHSLTAKATP